jgi:hypothetical protein
MDAAMAMATSKDAHRTLPGFEPSIRKRPFRFEPDWGELPDEIKR